MFLFFLKLIHRINAKVKQHCCRKELIIIYEGQVQGWLSQSSKRGTFVTQSLPRLLLTLTKILLNAICDFITSVY